MRKLVSSLVLFMGLFGSTLAVAKTFSCTVGKSIEGGQSDVLGTVDVNTDEENNFKPVQAIENKLFALCGSNKGEENGATTHELVCLFVTPKAGFITTTDSLRKIKNTKSINADFDLRAGGITNIESPNLIVITTHESVEKTSFFTYCH